MPIKHLPTLPQFLPSFSFVVTNQAIQPKLKTFFQTSFFARVCVSTDDGQIVFLALPVPLPQVDPVSDVGGLQPRTGDETDRGGGVQPGARVQGRRRVPRQQYKLLQGEVSSTKQQDRHGSRTWPRKKFGGSESTEYYRLLILLTEINIIYRDNQIFGGFKYSQKT